MTTAPNEERNPAQLALIARVTRVVGYTPPGLSDLLRVLAHPDVITNTRAFLVEEETN